MTRLQLEAPASDKTATVHQADGLAIPSQAGVKKAKSYSQVEVEKWTVEQVLEWMNDNELQEFSEIFKSTASLPKISRKEDQGHSAC